LLDKLDPEKITGSINYVARITGESDWAVKNKLRLGLYRAKKSGRRTLILLDSVRQAVASLPDAEFSRPRTRTKRSTVREATAEAMIRQNERPSRGDKDGLSGLSSCGDHRRPSSQSKRPGPPAREAYRRPFEKGGER
jgi:hypothetical protein